MPQHSAGCATPGKNQKRCKHTKISASGHRRSDPFLSSDFTRLKTGNSFHGNAWTKWAASRQLKLSRSACGADIEKFRSRLSRKLEWKRSKCSKLCEAMPSDRVRPGYHEAHCRPKYRKEVTHEPLSARQRRSSRHCRDHPVSRLSILEAVLQIAGVRFGETATLRQFHEDSLKMRRPERQGGGRHFRVNVQSIDLLRGKWRE